MADLGVLLGAGGIIFAAAFVQGVTGFAHALVAIGTLSLLFGSSEHAILVLSLIAPFISLAIFVRVWRDVVWKEVLLIFIPLGLIGTPLGIWAFKVIDKDLLTRIVGAFLIVSAGYFLTPWAPRPQKVHPAIGVAAGLVAGFLTGLTATGGPPLVLYLYAREMPKRERMAIMQGVFVLGSITKVAMLFPAGLVTWPLVWDSAILVPPLLAGVLLGQRLFDRLPAETIRKAALVLLVVIGFVLLF